MKSQTTIRKSVSRNADELMKEADKLLNKPRHQVDHTRIFQLYKEAERLGSVEAYNRVGYCYWLGRGVDMNIHLAGKYFLKAARMGNASAMYNLAHMMNGEGKGCKMGQERAIYWFEKAAEKGLLSAYWNLGYAYLNGEGVQIDYDKAFEWFLRGGDLGNSSCYTQAGLMCFQGLGMPEDHEQAVAWFKEAAADENSDACLYLGYCYEHGDGVRRSLKKAYEHYEKADMFGNVNALDEIVAFQRKHPLFKLYKSTSLVLGFYIYKFNLFLKRHSNA